MSRGVPETTAVSLDISVSCGTTVTSLPIISLRSSVPLEQPAPIGVSAAIRMQRRVKIRYTNRCRILCCFQFERYQKQT